MDETYKLAEAFYREYKKYAPYPLFSLKKVKGTKWWKIFQGIISKFGEDEDWDAYKYVKYAFDELGRIYPFHLSNKNVYQDYKDHLKTRVKDKKSIALSIKGTLTEIQKWSQKRGESLDVKAFFNDPKNKMFLFRGKYSKYLLAIIKTYYSLTEKEKRSIMSEEEEMAKRMAVLNDEELKKKMEVILGDEFINR